MAARKSGYFRRPRTTQERRWNGVHKKYVRGRRSPRLIPSAWEDQYRWTADTISWKAKFKKRRQWMDAPYQEKWNLRLGFWVTPNCSKRKTWPWTLPQRCPGCPICHKRNKKF